MIIEGAGIEKSYGEVKVLKGIDIRVEKGAVVSIVGASGAGKSTLLHILGTLDRMDSGKLLVDDQQVETFNEKQMAAFRNRHIGFIFQFHHLLPEFTALENVCIPAFIAGDPVPGSERRAMELLSLLGLAERATHKPSQLSGGEQQRVAVARALINNPSLVLADEPSGNLDSESSRQLHKLFFDLRDKLGQTFVIVTHNEELAGMADKKFSIKDGIIA